MIQRLLESIGLRLAAMYFGASAVLIGIAWAVNR